jgi:hypothetical protein
MKIFSCISFSGARAAVFLLYFSCGIFSYGTAETLVLSTGETIRGRMLDMDADTITLEVFGVPQVYSLNEVKSIDGKDFAMPSAIIDPASLQPPQRSETAAAIQQEAPPVAVSLAKEESRAPSYREPGSDPAAADGEKLEAIKKIKEKTPDKALAYFEIGYLHRSLGEDEPAFENYKKALRVDPDLGEKFFNQALDDFYLRRHIEARDKFLRARELFEVQEDARMMRLVNQQIRELYNDPEDDFFY